MGAIVACLFGAWSRYIAPSSRGARFARQVGFAALVCFFPPAPVSAKIHIPLISTAKREQVQDYGIGAWRLRISTSLFSGDVQCRLYRRDDKVIYRKNAVGFRFDDDADTLQAWVKMDGGPARRWRDTLPTLAAQRVPIGSRSLVAPTGGVVWLPLSDVEQVSKIGIQLRPGKRPRFFPMTGLMELLEAGRRLGCSPEERFLP